MTGLYKRILATLALVAIITTLGVLAQQYTSLNWLVVRETQLRELVNTNRIQSWLIGFLIYVCLSLIPGTPGKSVIFGWLFGFWAGVIMVDGALTIAAVVTFFASRFLFRDVVESRLGIHLVRFREKLESSAGFYLVMLRLIHAPYSLVNYAAGATNIVPARTFWWTTQIGLLPGTMVFVFAGARIPELAVLEKQGALALLDRGLITALAATVVLPLILKSIGAVFNRSLARRHANCKTDSTKSVE
jgi:uncharacterized membrane protein YdjX (TVP38/TMEM64 family)